MITGLIVGFGVGLVVGWNFLPQPAFIKTWIAKLTGKV
jgi:hypothetical protein